GDRFEGRTRVRGTPHAVVTVVLPAGQPDITGVAGYRGETDVALGRDHVGVGGLEGDATVVTGVERAVGDRVEHVRVDPVGFHLCALGHPFGGLPRGTGGGGVVYPRTVGAPQHHRAVGVDGDGATTCHPVGFLATPPTLAGVRGDTDVGVGVVLGVTGTHHHGRVQFGEVQAGSVAPVGLVVHLVGDLVQVLVYEPTDVTHDRHQRRALGRRGQVVDGSLLQSVHLDLDVHGGVGVPVREVVTAVDGGAGAVHEPIGVERVDGHALAHPAELGLGLGGLRLASEVQPRSGGDVQLVPVLALGVVSVVPRLRPGLTAVGAAEDLVVRPPGDLCGDHERVRVLPVDGQTAITPRVLLTAGYGRDVGPLLGFGVEAPHLPGFPVVGAGGGGGGEVELPTLVVEFGVRGKVAGRCAFEGFPAPAAVLAAVDRGVEVGHAHVDVLGGLTVGPGAGVELHPGHTDDVVVHAPFVVGVLDVVAGVGEFLHLCPGLTEVGAAPQTVAAPGTEVHGAVVVGVDGQSFTEATPWHVPTEFERQLGDLPRLSPVVGTQDRAVVGVPVVGVGTGRCVDTVGVDGVAGKADDTCPSPFYPADPVQHGFPAFDRRVPTIGAADVGAVVDQVGFGFVEDDTGDKPTTADLHVVPHVAVLCGGSVVGVGADGGGGDCGGGREEYGHPGQEGPSTRSAPRSFSMSSPYVVFSGVRRHGAGSCVLTVRSPTETSGTRWTAMNGHHSEEPARVR